MLIHDVVNYLQLYLYLARAAVLQMYKTATLVATRAAIEIYRRTSITALLLESWGSVRCIEWALMHSKFGSGE